MRPKHGRTLGVFCLLTCWVLLATIGFTGFFNPITTSQAQASRPAEAVHSLLLHPITAPNAALNQPIARPSGAPLGTKGVALAFVESQRQAAIAVAPTLGWKVERSEKLDGAELVRVGQYKAHVRIFGADLALQVGGNRVLSAAGRFLPDIAADTKPKLGLAAAFKRARLAVKPNTAGAEPASGIAKPVLAEHELVFFNPAMFDAGPAATVLAYRLVLEDQRGLDSVTVLVDANNGKVLLRYDNHPDSRNRVIRDATNAQNAGTNCYIESGPVGNPAPECVAAFQFTGETYDYFFNTHARDSFNGNGAAMLLTVRYGTVANAFWNGVDTRFGPGFATRDVVGHEWAHAVTQYTAGLIYSNQSGAMNESYSDIFGAMIDRDDWLLGEDTPIGALRSLANPPQFGDPDRVSNYNCSPGDNGGVHTNSGIPNKLAYLMSEGGTFNGRTITAIGRGPTERIFYRALTAYLTPSSGFAQLNSALLSAATDLFGQGSANYNTTENAALAVELNSALPCGGTVNPDAYEPDNASGAARPISVDGTVQQHNFHLAGDEDWVVFNTVAGGTYVIETLNLQSAADTVLTLYDTNGSSVLAENDDSNGTRASQIAWNAPANGSYFARVRDYNPASGGANTGYELRITGTTPPPQGDAYEPDDSQGAAQPISTDGTAQQHNFHVAGDQDWVRFSATAGTTYVLETFDLGSTSDTVLELFDSSGASLAFNDDFEGSLRSQITWSAPAAGDYALNVRHYDASAEGGSTSYSLRVTGAAVVGDSFEPDNTQANASAIDPNGAAQAHTIHEAGDEDWASFAADAGSSITVETFDLAEGTDTVLELYDSAGNLLASNDDTDGLASRVSYTATAADTLAARVFHFSPEAGGDSISYSLRVSATSGAGGDAYEPDNDTGQASPLVPNSAAQQHDFHVPGDEDWVSFDAVAGNSYILAPTDNLQANADTFMNLVDSDGATMLQSDDDSGPGLASLINWVAPSDGTYFVHVRHYDASADGADTGYELSISAEGGNGQIDGYEPDDSSAQASTLEVNGTGQSHNFHIPGDEDWATFEAQGGTEYTIKTSDLGTLGDTVLELYDSSLTLLASNDDIDTGNYASEIIYQANASETYYVRVRHFFNETGGANTEYTLQALDSGVDTYESDDSPDQASLTEIDGASQTHTFHVAGDQDWVAFEAGAGTTFAVDTFNLGECSDTVLALYDDAGTLLDENDDYNGLGSHVVGTAQASGFFFAQVRHYSADAAGACTSYDLAVSTAAAGIQPAVDLKVESVQPTTISLDTGGDLSILVSGLVGLPKVYLVGESSSIQLTNVRALPDAPDTLLAEVLPSMKPGTYKVRVVDTNGAEAISSESVQLLAAGQPTATPTSTPTATVKPDDNPTPTATPTATPPIGTGGEGSVYLPLVLR